jgi:hypothetical protein
MLNSTVTYSNKENDKYQRELKAFLNKKYIKSLIKEYTFPISDDTSSNLFLNSISPTFTNLSESSFENKMNYFRLNQYYHSTDELLQLIKDTDFEYGFDTPLDFFLREKIQQNSFATKQWLNTVFNENFDNVEIITGILRTIAHLSYDEIAPQGMTMAISALSHKNSEVRECGIRTCENWAHPESLKILKNVEVHEKWLKDYIHQVILDLEEDFV